MIVYIGLSGGVDSSVSALLLKQQGYDVRGVFIKTWQPDYIECTWKEDRLDAMRVAAQLDIPFETLDLEDVYKEHVVDYMINEYIAGRTPNPDIMCNKDIKFGAFYRYIKSIDKDAKLATGHYASISLVSGPTPNSSPEGRSAKPFVFSPSPEGMAGEGPLFNLSLKIALDSSKDQVYFLSQLDKNILADIIFPLGDKLKSEVRQIAKDNNLYVADKKDSQGICMLGDISMKDFLRHEIKSRIKTNSHLAHLLHKGEVYCEDARIGEHDGAIFYTVGEKIAITNSKDESHIHHYVIGKDIMRNIVYVSRDKFLATKRDSYMIKMWNYTSSLVLEEGAIYEGQTRYHGPMYRFRILGSEMCIEMDDIMNLSDDRDISFNYNVRLEALDENTLMPSGQTIVLYQGDIMIGGGLIE